MKPLLSSPEEEYFSWIQSEFSLSSIFFFFLETIDLFLRAHKKHRNRKLKGMNERTKNFFHNYLVTLDFNILLGFHVEKFKQ